MLLSTWFPLQSSDLSADTRTSLWPSGCRGTCQRMTLLGLSKRMLQSQKCKMPATVSLTVEGDVSDATTIESHGLRSELASFSSLENEIKSLRSELNTSRFNEREMFDALSNVMIQRLHPQHCKADIWIPLPFFSSGLFYGLHIKALRCIWNRLFEGSRLCSAIRRQRVPVSPLCCIQHHALENGISSLGSENPILLPRMRRSCDPLLVVQVCSEDFWFCPLRGMQQSAAVELPGAITEVTGLWWTVNGPGVAFPAVILTVPAQHGSCGSVDNQYQFLRKWIGCARRIQRKGVKRGICPIAEVLAYTTGNVVRDDVEDGASSARWRPCNDPADTEDAFQPVLIQRRLSGPSFQTVVEKENSRRPLGITENELQRNETDYVCFKLVCCMRAIQQVQNFARLALRHNGLSLRALVLDACMAHYPELQPDKPFDVKLCELQNVSKLLDRTCVNMLTSEESLWLAAPEIIQLQSVAALYGEEASSDAGIVAGRTADLWSLGVTLVCFLLGKTVSDIAQECLSTGLQPLTYHAESKRWEMAPDAWIEAFKERVFCTTPPSSLCSSFQQATREAARGICDTLIVAQRYDRDAERALVALRDVADRVPDGQNCAQGAKKPDFQKVLGAQ